MLIKFIAHLGTLSMFSQVPSYFLGQFTYNILTQAKTEKKSNSRLI